MLDFDYCFFWVYWDNYMGFDFCWFGVLIDFHVKPTLHFWNVPYCSVSLDFFCCTVLYISYMLLNLVNITLKIFASAFIAILVCSFLVISLQLVLGFYWLHKSWTLFSPLLILEEMKNWDCVDCSGFFTFSLECWYLWNNLLEFLLTQ